MKASSFHAITAALAKHKVRYIVVGGLAVIAHGYLRATRDADLVVELIPENIKSAFTALGEIGYRPIAPVTVEQFSDTQLRNTWHREKNMEVLQFWSKTYPDTPIDVFIQQPFDFQSEWDAAKCDLTGAHKIPIRFASIPTLIAMKQTADRPKDQIDVEYLRQIQQASGE
ncbi:MAG: hypothetical protein HRU10_10400 [Opitutales bacterium]|nr:hypothetical protein [Opitutales bacterium]